MAERVGFEPTVPVKAHSISNAARSATLAPLLKCIESTIIVVANGQQEKNKTIGLQF